MQFRLAKLTLHNTDVDSLAKFHNKQPKILLKPQFSILVILFIL
jgi:hypothetical protein